MENNLVQIAFLAALFFGGALYVYFGSRRSAADVLEDLAEEEPLPLGKPETGKQKKEIDRELEEAGLYTREAKRKFLFRQRIYPVVGLVLFPFLRSLAGGATVTSLLPFCVMGLAIGYLVARRKLANKKAQFLRDVEFFLPVIMERLVMAVQAGLDVFAGIAVILELEEDELEKDPVTELLGRAYRLTERGMTFEDALRTIAESVDSAPLRHAFIHLALAQREGGELVFPLRELSDSTQLYYQETVEHGIAKLPVKATMPLLVTFVGLIILFITSPILQVLNLTAGAMPK
ncbi:MAG: type II secretion system F family protein [Bdellovibrionales bacterium]|nr:type II secretion system F family protein [Bdellovibrionales bacterium]